MTANEIQSIAELVAFWETRLAETAAVAGAAGEAYPGPWVAGTDFSDEQQVTGRFVAAPAGVIVAVAGSTGSKGAAVVALATGHDPSRVLADVNADLALLAAWREADRRNQLDEWGLAEAIRIRAAVYASCPGYKPEWGP